MEKNGIKVIDFHTHIFTDAIADRARASLIEGARGLYYPVHDMTLAGLIGFMDNAGVDKSVVLPVLTKQTQIYKTDEWAAQIESDRIIPFAGVYPTEEHYKEDIDFVCSLGFKGIKLHCEYQHFTVDEPRMLKFYDYAFNKGLIIVQHGGFDPAFPAPFKSSPQMFRNVWDAMQGGTMIAAHFGGHGQWDDVEKYLVGTGIYLDTSMGSKYYDKEQFLRIVRAHGADKILFATDSPWSDAAEELDFMRGLSLSDDEKTAILSGNAIRLLGLN